MERQKVSNFIILPAIIFIFAFVLRRYFFCGFILGDDAQEFPLVQHLLTHSPNFSDQLQQRFGTWIFNFISLKLFGVSETSYFLPTLIMSSSFSVIGYFLLVFWGYKAWHAFTASLFIASAPFEVLIGAVRANDIILSWLLALGFLFLIFYEKKPFLQGLSLAFFLWLAFYVKLWVVYLFPALGIYYIVQIYRTKIWRGLFSLCFFSALLHAGTGIFWKIEVDSFFPFITNHAANYPVARSGLSQLFMVYPEMLFRGSEFGTTFFGPLPYILVGLLILKIVFTVFSKKFPAKLKLDKLDIYLLSYYMTFFIFLNFFPNAFKFDQYYSTPRIFRYLTPISFPVTLHIAKMAVDFSSTDFRWPLLRTVIKPLLLFMPLLVTNIYHADNATGPGRIYRQALMSIVKDVKKQSPPQLLSESWMGGFLREIYLKDERDKISVLLKFTVHDAKEYEKWLLDEQRTFPDGTMLITGLGSNVYYTRTDSGFRLKYFTGALDPGWKLFKEYNMLNYQPMPEPARLWVWSPQ